ncbi:MAG: hypothetical protein HYY55_00925 [Candidatus Niyogibacteria bacterium]|nr:MAG: hypothetical protein HYY55_00925 [Candidatus Niyogibacteria bacterium]
MSSYPKIGIAGAGMVGGAVKRYFEEKGFKRGKNLFCYDPDAGKKCFDDLNEAEIIFICVPTPQKRDGSCDTNIVESAVKKYAPSAKVMVIKSTVIPGTTERLAKKYNCALAFSPEFLTEARSWENMIHPDRQIVAPTAKAKTAASSILHLLPEAPFTAPRHKRAVKWADINPTEAELGKYAANSFGALKVTFANLIYDFAQTLEEFMRKNGVRAKINYENIRHILANDPRIGDSWLNVAYGDYRGYGGYCFPKDTEALIVLGREIARSAPKNKSRALFMKGLKLFEAMREYNNAVLASQGLNVDNVSRHDRELLKLIKKYKKIKYG